MPDSGQKKWSMNTPLDVMELYKTSDTVTMLLSIA